MNSLEDLSKPESSSNDSPGGLPGEYEPVDSKSRLRALMLIVRFDSLLVHGARGEYNIIRLDHSTVER
jgi:hypothetical protein